MTGELPPHRIVRLEDDAVVVLDQRRLPDEEVELRCATAAELAEAIRVLAVRGAPAIGVAAAYGLALAAERGDDVDEALEILAASRPTAVNLRWALDEMRAGADPRAGRGDPRRRGRALPAHGRERARALPGRCPRPHPLQRGRPGDGRLRLGGRRDPRRRGGGSRRARLGRRDPAAAPGQQADRLGARAARHPARGDRRRGRRVAHGRGEVDLVVTGADRIAANGDIANKIGTYALAVLAAHHDLPLVVVAPTSTLDPDAPTGAAIPIEERDGAEVTARFPARNPAFDVTPAALVAAIVTEHGVHRAPYAESLPREVAAAR